MTNAPRLELIEVRINWPGDVPSAEDQAARFAGSAGFPAAACAEVGVVVKELAFNLLRHASGGLIRLRELKGNGRRGVEIDASDDGPGISDIEEAIKDGYSTAGGLGLGLGIVNRFMDELNVHSGPNGGLEVVCRRWLRPALSLRDSSGLLFGAATRSWRRIPENGDAFLFKSWEGHALAGVIDGLGHGQFARRAAQTAREYVEQHFDQPLENVFRGVGRACRATRGVVMALAQFDLERRKLIVASVGNVEARLLGSPEPFRLIVRRGIVGLNAPAPLSTEHSWTSPAVLIMHSDGLRTHWDSNDFIHLRAAPPDVIAHQLLSKFGKPDDDVTVVVARSAD